MERMPALFVGHGSPMNAIEDNGFTRGWRQIAADMPRPRAILAISAHWYTHGSLVADTREPRMIYDFYGFPKALYGVRYPVAGAPDVARRALTLINGQDAVPADPAILAGSADQDAGRNGGPGCEAGVPGRTVRIDNEWGIDHGTWSVLCRMYPEADIPVCQLSVDRDADAMTHFRIGQALAPLRDEGVLIFGSGNVVHNLALVDWSMDGGFPWAESFDGYIHDCVRDRRFDGAVAYDRAGDPARIAFHMPDHYFPLLYTLGAALPDDRLAVYNRACTLGSLSMTSYLFSH